MRVTNKNAIVNVCKDNAFLIGKYTGINAALNKTAILKAIAQFGKRIISSLLKPVKTLVKLENVVLAIVIVWSIKPIGNSM